LAHRNNLDLEIKWVKGKENPADSLTRGGQKFLTKIK
jgi:hypothetical protein